MSQERKLRTPALAATGIVTDDHGCVLCPHCPEADCYAALSVRFESYATLDASMFERGILHRLTDQDGETRYWRVECPSGHVVLTCHDFELDPETILPFDVRMLTHVGTIIIPTFSGVPWWLPEDDPTLRGALEGYAIEATLPNDDSFAGRAAHVRPYVANDRGLWAELDYGYGFPLRGAVVEVDERSFESAADAAERAGVDPDLLGAREEHDGKTPPPDAPSHALPEETT